MLALLAFALAAPVPKDVPAHRSADVPKEWKIEDLEKVMDRHSPAGKSHVLVWERIDTKRPLLMDYVLVLKVLDEPAEDGARFVLASFGRSPEGRHGWLLGFATVTEEKPNGVPVVVHLEALRSFESAPDDKEIAAFLKRHLWAHSLEPEGKRVPELTAGGVVSANWKAVLNRQPKAELFPELRASAK